MRLFWSHRHAKGFPDFALLAPIAYTNYLIHITGKCHYWLIASCHANQDIFDAAATGKQFGIISEELPFRGSRKTLDVFYFKPVDGTHHSDPTISDEWSWYFRGEATGASQQSMVRKPGGWEGNRSATTMRPSDGIWSPYKPNQCTSNPLESIVA